MMNRYQCGIWLSQTIGWNPSHYIPDDCKRLIFDWKILDELVEANLSETRFSDFSFAMAPMYKATEGVLWKIAIDLGIEKSDNILGNFFDEGNLIKIYPLIEKSTTNKLKVEELKHELSELKTFLRRYRHNPAHFKKKFKTLQEARLASHSALHNIKCVIDDLLEAKLIAIPEPTEKPQQEIQSDIDPNDIPF